MRMRWKTGHPGRSGVYLAWNPSEDIQPTLLSYSGGVWSYKINRIALADSVTPYALAVMLRLFDGLKEELKLSKAQIEKAERLFEDALIIEEALLEVAADGADCVYDVGEPSAWAELPELYSFPDDDVSSAILSGSPDSLDIEIEDIKASAINNVADNLARVLSVELSRIQSPWAGSVSPWCKGSDNA